MGKSHLEKWVKNTVTNEGKCTNIEKNFDTPSTLNEQKFYYTRVIITNSI